MARQRVRTHVVHGKRGTYTRTEHSRVGPNGQPKPRPRKPRKVRPKRALRNARKALRAAKRNQGFAFLAFGSAAVSEAMAFTVLRGGGGLLSALGTGLFGLGTAMRART